MPRSEEDAKKYPLCTKLAANADNRRTVAEFLDWAGAQGIVLMDGHEEVRVEDLWLKYLEITPGALDRERRAMLDEQRKANERPKMPDDIDTGCDGDCG